LKQEAGIMAEPRRVLYFAENALSAIQGGGIVAYAVLQGLPADRLLGFYHYRNITPVPEYADRFVYLGDWRTPPALHAINRLTGGTSAGTLHRLFTEQYVRADFAEVQRHIERTQFTPEAVYFSGLSYRYLRLAVMAAEHYDLPMVTLHMDDWMEVEREAAGRWGTVWSRRIQEQITRAAARALVSTSNSPRLAAKLSSMTGYRHVAANNCCSDLMPHCTAPARTRPNRIPIITYAGAMNRHLQGETLKVLASAVTELNAEGTRVHLHIYTPWEFAPEANSVAVPHAVFYKGQVGREQLADIYQRADVLATTVTYRDKNISLFRHSLSTKLSEYLCAGKPVLSMGHADWHLHEYVQDHGCGFSILMDEGFSRARIKAQLRRMLATDPSVLEDIGRRNRLLWEQSHDVALMARDTRRALRLDAEDRDLPLSSPGRRRSAAADAPCGALWMGGADTGAGPAWVPAMKLTAICRRLFDVFGHRTVDLVGHEVLEHPQLHEVLGYCRDIGLEHGAVIDAGAIALHRPRWECAGTRWSLDAAQRAAHEAFDEPRNLFDQVARLRSVEPSTALAPHIRRAIAELSVRVPESGSRRPSVWVYGSTAVGLDVIDAIQRHPWLKDAASIGGFLSSPGHGTADTLHGQPWRSADQAAALGADHIVVTSETSRLSIQEELSRLGLLDRMVPIYGLRAASFTYERVPSGPGQAYVEGFTAAEYADRELRARLAVEQPRDRRAA
jgi:glycosyltransferase involved in cell wall biosynthesis